MKKELHVGETLKILIRKSDIFYKIRRHVRHSMILICTLISSMEKIDQHFEKMFTKNIISPTCNNGQIYMLMYYWGNKNNFLQNFENPPNK